MQTLIDAIDANRKHFNMQCFIGQTGFGYDYGNNLQPYQMNSRSEYTIAEGTTLFSGCNTVGCIAGFATAIANKWTMPAETKANMEFYTKTANEFLGFNYQEGTNLFFADQHSVWKLVKSVYGSDSNENNAILPEMYGELEFDDESLSRLYVTDEDDSAYTEDDSEMAIEYKTISPEIAIDVLQRILSGEIILAGLSGTPSFVINQLA